MVCREGVLMSGVVWCGVSTCHNFHLARLSDLRQTLLLKRVNGLEGVRRVRRGKKG